VTKEPVRLMIPGPVDAEEAVLASMAHRVIPHYGQQWLELYQEAIAGLQQVFGTRDDIIMMAGPGTAGLEAALGSLMQTGEKVLMASNGFFGERLVTVARSYGLEPVQVTAPLGQPLDPAVIRQRLSEEPDVQAVTVVHLETSTGVLNPLQEIAAVTDAFGVPIIVDAVSSLGGVPLPVDDWKIDVCVTVINKCLACPPALAPMSVSRRAWDQIDRKPDRAHGWYLNLRTWKDYSIHWGSWHPYPTTLPTNNILGLLTSLRLILAEGLEAHYRRHIEAAEKVRGALQAWGFEMFPDKAHASPLITAMYGLPGMDIDDLRRYLLQEWGIMISGGLEELSGKIFRVGHMGKAASREYVDCFLDGMEAYLRLQGQAVPPWAELV
jgi:alanine-glyoxylate transaminase / serine-glyoxylate transaminase / serine-pyruvate transaminase